MFNDYNEFDIALALYHWLQHSWNSQTDPLYDAFCVLTEPGMYKPSRSDELFENLDSEALDIYNLLSRDNCEYALNKVTGYVCECVDCPSNKK